GMRKLFRRNGYLVYLIDEFRTSCRCHKCESELETFMKRENPRPWRQGNIVEVHGLLRCTSAKCGTVYNRDYNACQNMILIAENAINGKIRPQYLSRKKDHVPASALKEEQRV